MFRQRLDLSIERIKARAVRQPLFGVQAGARATASLGSAHIRSTLRAG
jgi:hypothetical protein